MFRRTKTRWLAAAALTATVALTAAGCSSSGGEAASTGTPTADASGVTTLRVGAMFPATEILQYVEDTQAADLGIDLEITEFSEYTVVNTSLDDGSLDANLYQHVPYLNNFNTEHGTSIVPVGKVYFPALALYSKKIDSVDALKDGDTVSIPADATNQLRSLQLLQEAGLITLKDGAAGVADIATNPKNLQFQELDAATLPRALDDVTAGIVNLVYALPAGLTGDDQIFAEDVDGTKYTNVLATNEGSENEPAIQALYEALTSPETQEFIETEYSGLVIPASGPAE